MREFRRKAAFCRALHLAVIALGVAILATACGGSGSDKASTSTVGATSTTAQPTTTTVAAVTTGNKDPLGKKSAIVATDLGSQFTVFAKAQAWQPVGSKSCSIGKESPLTTADYVYAGPQVKDPEGEFFVYSQSFVFRDAASAKAYADFRDTKEFRSCKVKQDQDAERTRNPKNYVKLTDQTYADARVTSFYRELVGGPDANGKPVDQGEYDRYTYQRGRVVVVISIDATLPSTAEAAAFNERVTTAFNAAIGALDARTPSA